MQVEEIYDFEVFPILCWVVMVGLSTFIEQTYSLESLLNNAKEPKGVDSLYQWR
jgi:hypothetical protein